MTDHATLHTDQENACSAVELFEAKMNVICNVMDTLTPAGQGSIIIMLSIAHLCSIADNEAREIVRNTMINQIDSGVADLLQRIQGDDLSPSKLDRLALMPDMPTTRQ